MAVNADVSWNRSAISVQCFDPDATAIVIPARIGELTIKTCILNMTWQETDSYTLTISDGIEGLYGEALKASSVTLPNTLKVLNSPFAGNRLLTEIELPASLETLGSWAFRECGRLQTVTFLKDANGKSNLKSIGDNVFEATRVRSIELPEGLTSLGKYAFSRSTIQTITLPDSLETIGDYAFDKASYLESITLPASLKTLGWASFQYAQRLTSVDMSKCTQLTVIESHMFTNCTALRSIIMSDSITELQASAFAGLTDDEHPGTPEIRWSAGLKTIGDTAFADSFRADTPTTIALPDSVESIGNSAFAGCDIDLADGKLPAALTSLGEEAFTETGLTRLVIPETLIVLKGGSFSKCGQLEEVVLHHGIKGIEYNVFSGDENARFAYADGTETEAGKLILPNDLEFVEASAFRTVPITEAVVGEKVQMFGKPFEPKYGEAKPGFTIHFLSKSDALPSGIYFAPADYAHTDVWCYCDSAAHIWAEQMKTQYPDLVTIHLYEGENLVLKLELRDKNGTVLSESSMYDSLVWKNLSTNESWDDEGWSLPGMSGADKFECTITFSDRAYSRYLVPRTLTFEFDPAADGETFDRVASVTLADRTSADLVGKVENAASLENLTVVLKKDEETKTATVSGDGSFRFPDIPRARSYTLEITAKEYETLKIADAAIKSVNAAGETDLGTVTLTKLPLNRTIYSQSYTDAVDIQAISSLFGWHANQNMELVYHRDGKERLFTDFRTGSLYDGRFVIYLGTSANDLLRPGEMVTLCHKQENSRYTMTDVSFTLKYRGEEYEPLAPTFDTAAQVIVPWTYNNQYQYCIFSEEKGELVYSGSGTTYLPAGTYTLVGFRSNNFITKIDSSDAFEVMGVPSQYYIKTSVTLAEGDTYTAPVPPPFITTTLTLNTSVGEAQQKNGQVPVYIQYRNEADDLLNLPGPMVTIYTRDREKTSGAELLLSKTDGRYVVMGDGSKPAETTGMTDGASRYQTLTFRLEKASGTICLLAPAQGQTLYISAGSTTATVQIPAQSFSVAPPASVTSEASGALRLTAYMATGSYTAKLYVNGAVQKEQTLNVKGLGENLIPYTLTRYGDGSASYTLQTEVFRKLPGGTEESVWLSDAYSVLLLQQGSDVPAPGEMNMRLSLGGAFKAQKKVDLADGILGKMPFTTYPRDFNEDNTFRSDLSIEYSLKMKHQSLVKDGQVLMTLYSGDKNNPTLTPLILKWNAQTETFDGSFLRKGGTYTISDLPYGFDLDYAEIPQETTWSAAQVQSQLNEKMELLNYIQSLFDTEATFVSVNMEDLEFFLSSYCTDMTERDKNIIRELTAMQNKLAELNAQMEKTVVAAFVDLTGSEDGLPNTVEDVLNLLNSFGNDAQAELLGDGDTLLDETELISMGYQKLTTEDSIIYVLAVPEQNYYSAVDLAERTHIWSGTQPQRAVRRSAMQLSASVVGEVALEAAKDIWLTLVGWTMSALEALDKDLSDVEKAFFDSYEMLADMQAQEAEIENAVKAYEQRLAMLEAERPVPSGKIMTEKELEESIKAIITDGYTRAKMQKQLNYLRSIRKAIADAKVVLASKNAQTASRLLNSSILNGLAKIGASKVVSQFSGPALSLISVVMEIVELGDTIDYVEGRIDSLHREQNLADSYLATITAEANGDCLEDPAAAREQANKCKKIVEDLKVDAEDAIDGLGALAYSKASILCLDILNTAVGIIPATKAASVGIGVGSFALSNVSELFCLIKIEKNQQAVDDAWKDVTKQCVNPLPFAKKDDCGGEENGDERGVASEDEKSPAFPIGTTPKIDPAGYAYEAVASNRVEGVTASIYYRDDAGNEQPWTDAPAYDEKSTQVTDAQGTFEWMTPPGKWRVKLTKSGYLPADSSSDPAAVDGWLPVLPPQLDVKIPMISTAAPTVNSAVMSGEKIKVTFSQYMDIAQVSGSDLVTVSQGGQAIPINISFEDAEESPTNPGVFYGRVMTISRSDGQGFTRSGLTVQVAKSAQNYVGTAMQTVYTNSSLATARPVGSIQHSYLNSFVTNIGEDTTITVQVLDTAGEPLEGVKVSVNAETGGTMTIDSTSISGSNGQAVFHLKGISAGDDVLHFSADGVRVSVNTRVSPLSTTAPAKPTANLSDFDNVPCGTKLVITAQDGASIRYTTDNTCPCTDAALTYTGPITLMESGFYRIAAWTAEGGYSERLNLHITVSGNPSSGGGGGGSYTPSYTVSVGGTQNGTITVSPQNASKGSTVTITVKPDKGYELDSLCVTDKNGDGVKVIEKSDEKYTFIMPGAKVTIEATFREIGPEQPVRKNPFVDVKESNYFYDAVLWAVEKGVTSGTSATTFAPNADCTRSQIVTFLWRAAGSPAPRSDVNPFTDVEVDSYYYDAVLWAVEQGITSGTSATTFSPAAACTRGQSATFLYRSAGSPAITSSNSFTDVSNRAYYADAVQWAVENSVTVGTSAATFSPDATCTRGQIVTLLYRYRGK